MKDERPLYQLAHEKRLPSRQVLDVVSQFYCYSNYHQYLHIDSEELTSLVHSAYLCNRDVVSELLSIISIDELSALFTPGRLETIHGVKHHLRVALIAGMLNRDASIIKDLILACLLHDSRRLNDKDDIGHGKRAAEFYASKLSLIGPKLIKARGYVPTHQAKILEAIARHDVETQDTHNVLLIALQKADALDRFRLPKLKWWPDSQKSSVHAFSTDELVIGMMMNILIPDSSKVNNLKAELC